MKQINGPAHDNKLSPAIESWGVWASLDRATWTVNGKSPFSPQRRQHFPFQAQPPSSGRGSSVALWLDERTGPLELQVLFWALPMTSHGLKMACLLFLSDARQTVLLASFTERTHPKAYSLLTESGHP